MSDFIVAGAGFSGTVVAERLASAGCSVEVVEKRSHVGGNAYDAYDSHGVLIHPYGPHIFHTNSDAVFEYLSQFTEWRPYEHRVLSRVDGQLFPVPINQTTINRLYGLNLDEAGVRRFFEQVREPRSPILTSEDVVVSAVGRELYEMFFRGYTRKAWGLDPSELSPVVCGRLPVRVNSDDRYFTDRHQAMPREGFTAMFRRMLDHPKIRLTLGEDFEPLKNRPKAARIIYTGPIDRYFNYRYGKLPYRSICFEHEHLPAVRQYQPVAVVNYPNHFDFTRVTEFKHLTGQEHPGTSIAREYPRSSGDPYYPVPTTANAALYKGYEALAEEQSNVTFLGRLAEYRYYNMDQAAAAALRVSAVLATGRDMRTAC
jgi:UDP-galactopyranose mutase